MKTITHFMNKRLFEMNKYAFLLVLLLGICPSTFGKELAVERWVVRYNGPGNGYDRASAMTIDSSNNVYVTGTSDGGGTNFDYATVKYRNNGTKLWAVRYNGQLNGNDRASALTVDSWSNVYVTGSSDGNYTTVKYAPDGSQLWAAHYDGPGNSFYDRANAIAVLDSSGCVYVTGVSDGGGTNLDYATIRYARNGAQLWEARYNGPSNKHDEACALALDSLGYVYVTGTSDGGSTNKDYATIQYDPDGAELWVARYNGPGNDRDEAHALVVDGSGNVYVTGGSYGSGTKYDYATIKYSPNGTQLWEARYDGPGMGNNDIAFALVVDDLGNVYVTGESSGAYATIKYAPNGAQLWVARYEAECLDGEATALSVNNSYVYVTGKTCSDCTTVKYSPNGKQLWAAHHDLPGNEITIASFLKTSIFRPANEPWTHLYVAVQNLGNSMYSDYTAIEYKQLRGIEFTMQLLKDYSKEIRIVVCMPLGMSVRDIDETAPLTLYPGEIEFSNWRISRGGLCWPFQAGFTINIQVPPGKVSPFRTMGHKEVVLAGRLRDGRNFFGNIFIRRP